jgi:hypothetical protein
MPCGGTIFVGKCYGLHIITFPRYFRYLSFVRNAFAGTPTLAKEIISEDDIRAGVATSDILWDPSSRLFQWC